MAWCAAEPKIASEWIMADGHPTDAELQDRAAFRLTISTAQMLDAHLHACPACNARYRDIAEDKPNAPAAPDPIDLSDPNTRDL